MPGALEYYRTRPAEFISDWVDTYDPRNAGKPGKITRMPFVLFPRQVDMVRFVVVLLEADEDGLVEKCRDFGATWVFVAVSVWLWLFWPGISVGWGSRKEQLVDKLGVLDSIFEKIRLVIRALPSVFLPVGLDAGKHFSYMRIINPETGATIVGEAGDNIGRGGRTRVYFVDEAAHIERPELVEAALGDNTRVRVDISSVNGIGNVFHRKRLGGVEWTGGDIAKSKVNVLVLDWRQHPEKTQEWYDNRRQKAIDSGMLHLFAQEVDRDYSSSVEGIIIEPEWVRAAIDAHKRLGFEPSGGWVAGLDVADEGADKNALAQRKGVVLLHIEDWAYGDTGETARKAVQVIGHKHVSMQYDCIGVGAGVKAETNRLRDIGQLPVGITVEPWSAAAKPLFPGEHVIEGDRESPTNGDYYANLSAQAAWELRGRFHRTYQAIYEGADHDQETLISIDSTIPVLDRLILELSQPTWKLSSATMKLMVDKKPAGTRSPNLFDAVKMAFWPVISSRYTLDNL